MATNATEFPYSLTITLPLPSSHLATSALRTLEVDTELSPFVRRDLELTAPSASTPAPATEKMEVEGEGKSVLRATYRATTNRMLRVAVNGFMESLGVVLGVMQELDVDVLEMDGGVKEEE